MAVDLPGRCSHFHFFGSKLKKDKKKSPETRRLMNPLCLANVGPRLTSERVQDMHFVDEAVIVVSLFCVWRAVAAWLTLVLLRSTVDCWIGKLGGGLLACPLLSSCSTLGHGLVNLLLYVIT